MVQRHRPVSYTHLVGALDPNPLVAGRGIEKIRNAGIEVKTGVLAEESIKLNEIFMKYIVNKEPFVLYKSAMSLDGKIATSTGESQWISCEASRREVHELRHQYMAIMVGSQTVLDDDPMLNCRLIEGKDPILSLIHILSNAWVTCLIQGNSSWKRLIKPHKRTVPHGTV